MDHDLAQLVAQIGEQLGRQDPLIAIWAPSQRPWLEQAVLAHVSRPRMGGYQINVQVFSYIQRVVESQVSRRVVGLVRTQLRTAFWSR